MGFNKFHSQYVDKAQTWPVLNIGIDLFFLLVKQMKSHRKCLKDGTGTFFRNGYKYFGAANPIDKEIISAFNVLVM